MKLVKVSKVYHNKYNTIDALKEVSVEFDNAGITAILGPSGSGKTTLLNIMAGKIKNYTGEVICDESIEFIEQEIMLFESMSIMDNLLIVGDKDKIYDYLKHFQMIEFKDKRVNELSIGQKKRVQIIRSLLLSPDTLLCDEPTSSLDHDNQVLVMDMLKDISLSKCVIVVTHEVNIAHQYSDRIIKIDNGKIEADKIIHQTQRTNIMNISSIPSIKKHMFFIKQIFLTRIGLSILSFCIFIIMVMSTYCSINMIQTVKSLSQTDLTVYYGKNIIASTPHQSRQDDLAFWSEFDNISVKQIQEIISQVPEIQAYTFGMDQANYVYVDRINETPFLEMNNNGVYSELSPKNPYVYMDENKTQKARIYEMSPTSNLKVQEGNICKNDNEAIVPLETALYYQKILGLENVSDIIGKSIKLEQEIYADTINPSYTYTITGILPYSNKYEYQIIIPYLSYQTSMNKNYQLNDNQWSYDYVDFMIDPSVSINQVIDRINNIYKGKDSSFDRKAYGQVPAFDLMLSGAISPDEIPDIDFTLIIEICLVIIFICFIVYGLFEFFFRKRNRKENYILSKYHFHVMGISFMKYLLYGGFIFIVFLLFGNIVIDFINIVFNQFFNQARSQNIVQYNIMQMGLSILLSMILIMIGEVISYGTHFKKRT